MNISLAEFNPEPIRIELIGKTFSMKPFTLKSEAHFESKFESFVNFANEISKGNSEAILYALYYQLGIEEKYEKFVQKFVKIHIKEISPKLTELGNKLCECIDAAKPLTKHTKRERERMEIMKAQDVNFGKVNYAKFYDRVAARYGHTIEEFYNLTFRQFHMIMKAIDEAKQADFAMQAQLHDKKLKDQIKTVELNEEEEVEAQADAEDALAMLKEKYKAKQNGK